MGFFLAWKMGLGDAIGWGVLGGLEIGIGFIGWILEMGLGCVV